MPDEEYISIEPREETLGTTGIILRLDGSYDYDSEENLIREKQLMPQHTPDPISLYESAVQQILPIIASIETKQLTCTTPCSEWNVQSLITHNLRVQEFVTTVLNGTMGDPGQMFTELNIAPPLKGGEAALIDATNTVLNTISSMSIDVVIDTIFGPMQAGHYLMIPMMDLVVHRWDLAKSTDQNSLIDDTLAEASLNVLEQAFQGGRLGTEFFGPLVESPVGASVQDQMLALSGRHP